MAKTINLHALVIFAQLSAKCMMFCKLSHITLAFKDIITPAQLLDLIRWIDDGRVTYFAAEIESWRFLPRISQQNITCSKSVGQNPSQHDKIQ